MKTSADPEELKKVLEDTVNETTPPERFSDISDLSL